MCVIVSFIFVVSQFTVHHHNYYFVLSISNETDEFFDISKTKKPTGMLTDG